MVLMKSWYFTNGKCGFIITLTIKKTEEKTMDEQKMIESFTDCICDIAADYMSNGVSFERNIAFCNAVSQIAFDRYNLNAADTTAEQDAFHAALDSYFE
jgi:hypothetical protein